ncbi:MAG: CotH kinase family protein [Clostridia bacterium]|nr:CotH kinase family protein [Clostridia bacterium]MBR5364984.1 CotH kinase family protein [Clostridia bacterium]
MKRTICFFLFFLFLFAVALTAGCRKNGKPIEADPSLQPVLPAAEPEPETEAPAALPEDGEILPLFSVEGGFYTTTKTLKISLPDGMPRGTKITYTTDCSEPTKNAKVFLDTIEVAKSSAVCSVIRAAVFDIDGNQISPVVTQTYLRADADRFGEDLLVFSLVTEKKNLTGTTGILDHPRGTGKTWERPCHVEIFTPSGERIVSQDAGIRIFGGSSRALPQKSFRLIARRDDYFDAEKYDGRGSFAYPFFVGRTVLSGESAGEEILKYDRLVLRNGGNDSIQATAADPRAMTLTRDAAANAFFAAHSDKIACQTSRFAVVYLNGEYYGILDMKEDINDDYLRNLYGLDKEFVTVIKSELDTTRHCGKHTDGGSCRFDDVWFYYAVDEGEDSELDAYEAMCRDALDALGGSKADLDAAYERLSEKLDTDSFLEYTALCLYVCNTDWPHNNIRVWRYTGDAEEGNPYTDGRWRYSTRDLDFSFGRYECLVLPEIYTQADTDNISFTLGNYKNGAYAYDGNYPDSLHLQGLLALCLHNDDFRARFLAYCETLCTDESAEELKAIMTSYAAQIEGEIARHLERWRGTIDGGYTPEVWQKNVDDMLRWAEDRPAYFREYLSFVEEYFG